MIRIILLFALIAGVLAVKFLPWWELLGGLVALVVLGKFLAGRLIKQLFLAPFKMKGAVLKGAQATIHGVTRVEGPQRSSEEEAEWANQDRECFSLDVTIRPTAGPGNFSLWEPGELLLVDMTAKPEDIEDDAAGIVESVEVFQDGAFQRDEACKYPGEQRLHLLVGARPGTVRLRFRYYFELFGEVAFPHVRALQPA
ncbi:MAG: hypothetical protein FJX76_08595 [Armatimonadetes bacterium]|nr:hypothetical protein [Armatimonadota bacterium]